MGEKVVDTDRIYLLDGNLEEQIEYTEKVLQEILREATEDKESKS